MTKVAPQAPPMELAEEALRQARDVCVFAYTVDYVPMDRIFRSRHFARAKKKATRGLQTRASRRPETLPPIVLLRSKAHPGYFAVAQGSDVYSAARRARLPGLWAVIADEWIECVS